MGFVRLSPLYETTDYVQDFLPDESLTDMTTVKIEMPDHDNADCVS